MYLCYYTSKNKTSTKNSKCFKETCFLIFEILFVVIASSKSDENYSRMHLMFAK